MAKNITVVHSMFHNDDVKLTLEYPEDIEYPPNEWLEKIGKKMKSPFVALDIAQDVNNKWCVIEVNDGGTAGLPEKVDLKEFYRLLQKGLS